MIKLSKSEVEESVLLNTNEPVRQKTIHEQLAAKRQEHKTHPLERCVYIIFGLAFVYGGLQIVYTMMTTMLSDLRLGN